MSKPDIWKHHYMAQSQIIGILLMNCQNNVAMLRLSTWSDATPALCSWNGDVEENPALDMQAFEVARDECIQVLHQNQIFSLKRIQLQQSVSGNTTQNCIII